MSDVSQSPSHLPRLKVTREKAKARIEERIKRGHELRGRVVRKAQGLRNLQEDVSKWNSDNQILLGEMFDDPLVYAQDYKRREFPSLGSIKRDGKKESTEFINHYLIRLEMILDSLDLYPETSNTASPHKPAILNNEIFIVHGHDETIREAVADFVRHLGFNPIILHEQADSGLTIIEKFEKHAQNVGFAIVLLTPDDEGKSMNDLETKSRARQNVILELGYFLGKLGRERVRALYSGGVELPSDLHGVLYIPIDQYGAWQTKLAKEMKAAGLDIDLNKL